MNQEEREKCRKEKEQEASTSNGETMETEVPKTTEQPPQAQEVPSAPKTPSTMVNFLSSIFTYKYFVKKSLNTTFSALIYMLKGETLLPNSIISPIPFYP